MTSVRPPRLTHTSLKVLRALLDAPNVGLAGAEITQLQNVAAGSLYPILARLEDAGWLRSRWETDRAEDLGRPRRRYYVLTAEGYRSAVNALRELQPESNHPSKGAAWA